MQISIESSCAPGHIVSEEWILDDPKKVEALKKWTRPVTAIEIQSLLGPIGYYRHFMQDFSKIIAPLTKLKNRM